MKYYEMQNVGMAKYLVCFHDGTKFHEDRSPFYDVRIYSNKRDKNAKVKELIKAGYKERGIGNDY